MSGTQNEYAASVTLAGIALQDFEIPAAMRATVQQVIERERDAV